MKCKQSDTILKVQVGVMIPPFETLKSSGKCDQTFGGVHRNDKVVYPRYDIVLYPQGGTELL